MNILVTGAAGFIGYYFCNKILNIIGKKKFNNIFKSIDETISWHKKIDY